MHNLSIEQLGKLVDHHGAALELFARQWTDFSAADVVQAAFVKLATKSLPQDQIVPWLYRVVRNGAISAARSESRRRRHEATGAQIRRGWFATSPDDRLDAIEAGKELSQLPQVEREVLVARLWGGLSFQEIADLLEISSSSAHRHYVAGLGTLREKLGVTWLKKNP
ncbi:RNA polymerase sigma factor [Schlesneria paludicola]|uniref:RNA polymerase sigma factor n=1 Tax=Schlesneria paludicola TaxID=360056 RepID=UPI000299F48B|nr:sigma-70 family RNA polymerase sigma factor [Schlesneria paludicola]